jgi:hypothetical protein
VGLLLLLLSLLFLAFGSGSSGVSGPALRSSSSATSSARSCATVVTSVNGKTVRHHSCHGTSGGSVRVHTRVAVKCSAHMTAGGKTTTRCSPPANP